LPVDLLKNIFDIILDICYNKVYQIRKELIKMIKVKNLDERTQRELKKRSRFNSKFHYLKKAIPEENGTTYIVGNRLITVFITIAMIPIYIVSETVTAFITSCKESFPDFKTCFENGSIFIVNKEIEEDREKEFEILREKYKR